MKNGERVMRQMHHAAWTHPDFIFCNRRNRARIEKSPRRWESPFPVYACSI
jgi:hypothetical protein